MFCKCPSNFRQTKPEPIKHIPIMCVCVTTGLIVVSYSGGETIVEVLTHLTGENHP